MFSPDVYQARRNALRKQLKQGIVLLLGNTDTPMNYPANIYRFRQDSSFLYFFGLNEPNMAGILDVENNIDYIVGTEVDIDDIIWMGPQPSLAERAQKTGLKNTMALSNLALFIDEAKRKGRTIHFLPPYRAQNKILLHELLSIPINALKENASVELIKAVVALRSIKEPCEIAEIEKAIEIGYKMHTTAMQMVTAGIYENEIAGAIEGIALQHNGSVSFPVICTINGQTLHNHYHGNQLQNEQLVLIDAGAETSMNYCSDFTRTIPVNKKYSNKQKEIYDIVCKANIEAIENCKPGIYYKDIHLLASEIITQGLIEIGLMKGNVSDAVNAGAHALFFPHGLGHMMGLDVHDMEDLGENFVGYDNTIKRSEQFGLAYLRLARRLQPGFVLTVEPGIYFIPELINKWKAEKHCADFINYNAVEQYRNFGGIRIEDDILITETGAKILGTPIPKTSNEIETFILDKS